MSISLDDALSNKKDGRAAAPSETLGALGIAQHRVAKLFGVGPRSVRRWQCGDRRVPCGVHIVLRLLAAGTVTLAQVEQAAVPIPSSSSDDPKTTPIPSESQTEEISPTVDPEINETAEPAESETPEHSALACVASADPAQTTAEKVLALAPGACRWPSGDPDRPDFHFCGGPAADGPYCDHHRSMAYNSSPPV
jgi:hypothetical protein